MNKLHSAMLIVFSISLNIAAAEATAVDNTLAPESAKIAADKEIIIAVPAAKPPVDPQATQAKAAVKITVVPPTVAVQTTQGVPAVVISIQPTK